jgi:hypothetical protein
MTRIIVTGIVAVAVMAASAAKAQTFEDGDSLYEKCSAEIGQLEYSSCQAYVSGVADVMGAGDSVDGYTACFPPDFKVGQAKDAVTEFLKSHPEWRHHTAAQLVAEALAKEFPCPP